MNKDNLQIRCPRLGGSVPFTYCEKPGNDGHPCFKVMDCWWQHFDIVDYLEKHLPAEAFAGLLNRQPPPKLTGILELIEQARRNSTPEPSD